MPRLRVSALLLLLAMVAGGCAQNKKSVDLGLRRITLDLSFKDQSKAQKPTLPQIVDVQQPFGPSAQLLGDVTQKTPIIGLPAPASCKSAPAGALPEEPVIGVVGKPPAVGIFTQHNTGTFSLNGPIHLEGKMPPLSAMEIANVTQSDGVDSTGGEVHTITYDVILRNIFSTTTTHYQSITRSVARALVYSPSALASELDLVSAETKTSTGTTTTFKPDQPVTMMQYNGEGASWDSSGIDQATGTVMVVRGTIARREHIDVCGMLVDTFRVESNENIVNPLTGFMSSTASDDPNVYNVATQFGGLVVSQHVDTSTTVPVGNATETLLINNTSIVNSIKPIVRPS